MAVQQDAEKAGWPLAPVVAGAAGLTVALAIALVPAWRVEAAVAASGLPALVPAAVPPLGLTARLGLMLGFGGAVTVLLWGALVLLFPHAVLGGGRRARVRANHALPDDAEPDDADGEAPVVRRADAHPDAPPRPPVRAVRDLGVPFLDTARPAGTVDSELSLPRDLDTPLALFDPLALPAVPAAPAPTVKPLFRAGSPVFPEPEPRPESEQEPRSEPEPLHQPAPASTPPLAELLARLDAGLARRDAPSPDDAPPPPLAPKLPAGLAATLGQLRRMATRD